MQPTSGRTGIDSGSSTWACAHSIGRGHAGTRLTRALERRERLSLECIGIDGRPVDPSSVLVYVLVVRYWNKSRYACRRWCRCRRPGRKEVGKRSAPARRARPSTGTSEDVPHRAVRARTCLRSRTNTRTGTRTCCYASQRRSHNFLPTDDLVLPQEEITALRLVPPRRAAVKQPAGILGAWSGTAEGGAAAGLAKSQSSSQLLSWATLHTGHLHRISGSPSSARVRAIREAEVKVVYDIRLGTGQLS
jgi:hypothetical protein